MVTRVMRGFFDGPDGIGRHCSLGAGLAFRWLLAALKVMARSYA